MISLDELIEEFGELKSVSAGVFHFQEEMKSFTYNYWITCTELQDLLVVSKNDVDTELSKAVFDAAPAHLADNKPTVFELACNSRGFTHVLAVPHTYHNYLKGTEGANRKDLFLCVPIYRCEFSGDESPDEFKYMHLHLVSIFDWARHKCPKIRVYFDNPATGGGTETSGALISYSTLKQEVDNLNGVSNGFIEITNWAQRVVEVLSPASENYILIYDRKDEETLAREDLLLKLTQLLG
jgi:hypothetical protein